MKKSTILTVIVLSAMLSGCAATNGSTSTSSPEVTTEPITDTEADTTDATGAPDIADTPITEPPELSSVDEKYVVGRTHSVTVVSIGGKVIIYQGDEATSFGEYDDAVALDMMGTPKIYLIDEINGSYSFHELYVSGRVNEAEKNMFTHYRILNNLLVTERGIFNPLMNQLVSYGSYTEGFITVESINLSDNDMSFTLSGHDKNGYSVTVKCEPSDATENSFCATSSEFESSDVLRAKLIKTVEIDGKFYTVTEDTTIREGMLEDIGEYKTLKYEPLLYKDNKVVLELSPDYVFAGIGDLICVQRANTTVQSIPAYEFIYNQNLEIIYNQPLYDLYQRPDGIYCAAKSPDKGAEYYLFNSDMTYYLEDGVQIGAYLLKDGKLYIGESEVLRIDYYIDGFVIKDIQIPMDSKCFTLTGVDKYGEPATVISKYYPNNTEFYSNFVYDYSGEIYRWTYSCTDYITSKEYLYTIESAIPSDKIKTVGEYTYVYGTRYLLKDGEIAYEVEPDYWIEIVGDYIAIGCGPSNCPKYYTSELKPIYSKGLYNLTQLSNGRYLARSGYEYQAEVQEYKAFIFDNKGTILWESEDDRECLLVGDSFMLMRDADKTVRLYTPDNKLLCEFPEWKDSFSFHDLLSGRYEKDGKVGYYFITEDEDDNKPYVQGAEYGTYGNRKWEFYYIPETDESGVIDNGYGEFAYAKPVLYLYPEAETEVTVTFDNPDRLTTVYPAYNGAWNVTAKPDGTLTDAKGRTYYALYWEEDSGTPIYRFTDGFCVRGEDSAEFLEDVLDSMGFTEREANEFIIYWLPIMEQNEYSLIRFELTEDRDAASGLNIYPKPDSVLRMAMHIKAADSLVDIPEQKLPAFERRGFVAVEWGGSVH